MPVEDRDVILAVGDLAKSFESRRLRRSQRVLAVDGVSFTLRAGQTLAVVGESGAGKSTVGRLVLRLMEPDAGTISFCGQDLRALRPRALRQIRSRMQMIFQDPYSSLDPKMTIADSVVEPLRFHTTMRRTERTTEVFALLERVGLRPDHADRYPHELSGGQLQRVAIARALATKPDLVVCDEPTASLDVSIQAQVVNLLRSLQAERGMAYLFISHDLSLVRSLADHIAVMYAGRIVEAGPADDIFDRPRHPYTRTLLEAVPVPDPRTRNLLAADPVGLANRGPAASGGCAFRSQCPEAAEPCRVPPALVEHGPVSVACHLRQDDRAPVLADRRS